MERFFGKYQNHVFITVLTVLFAAFFGIFFLKYGNPLIDVGRELFIPYAMVNFKTALFKDIICIYGPLPYIINAIFVKIFGADFSVYYFIGGLVSYIFLIFFYLIANFFLKPQTSFLVTLFTLLTCIFSGYKIFNFILPYSFATVYAVAFSAVFIYFSLLYLKNGKSSSFYLASFFLGLIILSKYDFAALLAPFLILIFYKKIPLKKCSIALCTFILPFLFFAAYCIFAKIGIADIVQNFKFISSMTKSPSFIYFYNSFSGFLPNFRRFFSIYPYLVVFFAFLIFPILFLCISNKFKHSKIPLISFIFNALYLIYFFFLFFILVNKTFYFSTIFCYFALFFAVLTCINALQFIFSDKKNKQDELIFFLTIFIFFCSLKILFHLSVAHYGVFYLSFIVLGLSVLFKKYLSKIPALKPLIIRHLTFTTLFVALVCFVAGIYAIPKSSVNPVITPSGKFYTESQPKLFDDVKNALSQTDEPVLGLPEGLFLNFAYRKKYEIYPTTFTPMDFEAYGEDYLINQVKRANPKIIIITARDTSDYGKKYICKDYGQDFCRKILEGYVLKSNNDGYLQVYERVR